MITTLPPVEDGWFNWDYQIFCDGSLGIIQTENNIAGAYRAHREWLLQGHKSSMANPWKGGMRLSVISPNGDCETIPLPMTRFPMVDRFLDGRILIASCHAKSEEKNGVLLDGSGVEIRRFHIGDCVEHLRVLPDGTFWVGYFDEGIFGDSVSASGLAQFNNVGDPIWSFNDPATQRGLYISDCYALTAVGSDIYSCFYADFPIVRITNGAVTSWLNEKIRGANALAVDRNRILLAGGYNDHKTRLALLKLENGSAQLVSSTTEQMIENAQLVQGHGDTIHIVKNDNWRRIKLSSMTN